MPRPVQARVQVQSLRPWWRSLPARHEFLRRGWHRSEHRPQTRRLLFWYHWRPKQLLEQCAFALD